jgi:hypothetical protein
VDEVFQAVPRMQNASQSQTRSGSRQSVDILCCFYVLHGRATYTTGPRLAIKPHTVQDRAVRVAPGDLVAVPWWHYPGLAHRLPLDQQACAVVRESS